jgi:hypothetical protein
VTTHQLLEGDWLMKRQALPKIHEPNTALQRYRTRDRLIVFLTTL